MGLLARLVQHLQNESEYEEKVDEFMLAYRHLFKPQEGLEQEQSLEAYAVFQQYEAMIDGMLEAFCATEGFATGEELHEALRRDLKGKPLTNLRGGYLKAVLGAGTYEGFLRTMLDYVGASEAATPGGEPSQAPPEASSALPAGVFTVLCPEGAAEGSVVSVVAPSGSTLQVQVPVGVQAGQAFTVLDPSAAAGEAAGQQGPFAGWSVEEATALGGAGLLPAFPGPGEAVWGFCPDGAGSGQWLAATVVQASHDGSGLVVTWSHDGSTVCLPPEHVSRGGAT